MISTQSNGINHAPVHVRMFSELQYQAFCYRNSTAYVLLRLRRCQQFDDYLCVFFSSTKRATKPQEIFFSYDLKSISEKTPRNQTGERMRALPAEKPPCVVRRDPYPIHPYTWRMENAMSVFRRGDTLSGFCVISNNHLKSIPKRRRRRRRRLIFDVGNKMVFGELGDQFSVLSG